MESLAYFRKMMLNCNQQLLQQHDFEVEESSLPAGQTFH